MCQSYTNQSFPPSGQAACLAGVTDGAAFNTDDYAEYPSTVGAVINFYGVAVISRINEPPRHSHVAAMHHKLRRPWALGGTTPKREAGGALYKVRGAMHGVRFWTTPVLNFVADFLAAYS